MIWNESTSRLAGPAKVPSMSNLSKCLGIETRPYQMRITSKAVQMLQGQFKRGDGGMDREVDSVMIESPTGSGKTVMGLLIARWMQQRYGFMIGWASHRSGLLDQALAENKRWGFGVDIRPVPLCDRRAPKVDLLIVDEAQHEGSNSMANLCRGVGAKKIVGLTATPVHSDRNRLFCDRVIKDVGIHTLIQEGYLARYRHFTIPDFDPYTVANTYLTEPNRWGKSLIFFHRLEQCLECQNMFKDAGIRSQIVTANSNRERQLERFATGELDVLINRNVLTEGFDCPDLQTVFCRPASRARTIQMVGRVLRKFPGLSHKQVVQSKDARHPFVKTAIADEQLTWSRDFWRSSVQGPRMAEASEYSPNVSTGSIANLSKIMLGHSKPEIPWQFQTAESA